MRITRRAGGGFSVRASAAEPALGVWQCEFDDTALMINGAISVGHGSAELDHGGPNEGWTLTLRLTGDVMSVEETAPDGKDGKPPFCTGDGRLAGAYFSQAAHRPDQRQAGH